MVQCLLVPLLSTFLLLFFSSDLIFLVVAGLLVPAAPSHIKAPVSSAGKLACMFSTHNNCCTTQRPVTNSLTLAMMKQM